MVEKEIERLEEYAQNNNIPIMQKDGLDFLIKFIKQNNIKNILEIGTAIAYSSIKMAMINKDIKITTIEKDEKRYQEAVKNIEKFKLSDRIEVILTDALELKLEEKYDLIFIDAAKAQNKRLFLKYENNLQKNGYIITDNLGFHGYVEKELQEIKSKNIRGLVRKIKDYIFFLKNNDNYQTIFYELGDGISISKRKV